MSHDSDLERYFHDRSAVLDLPHADVGTIRTRARHRRRRQAALRGGVAAALLAGGTLLVVDRGRDPDAQEQAAEGPARGAVPSPLDWTAVEVDPARGLGPSSAIVDTDDGVYGLSTAPGPIDPNSPAQPRHLYRSSDGTDWEDLGVPEGIYASSLAAADGSLYAVGTTAVGGEVTGVALARSGDGGEGWSTSDLPVDLAAVEPGFPGDVHVSDVGVARSGSTTVVTVSVRGNVDPALVLGDDPTAVDWYQDGDTLVFSPPCDAGVDDAGRPASTVPPSTTTAPAGGSASSGGPPPSGSASTDEPTITTEPSSTEAPPTTGPSSTEAPTTTGPPASGTDDPVASGGTTPSGATVPDCGTQRRSLAELGLTEGQVGLARGRTYIVTATDDGPFTTAEVLPDVGGFAGDLVVADDGWWYVAPVDGGDVPEVVALHSTDGATWASTPIQRGASILDVGLVDGRPVVLTEALAEGYSVQSTRIGSDGVPSTVSVDGAVGIAAGSGTYGHAVGPLGVAVVLSTSSRGTDLVVAHSLDGVAFSAQPLPEAPADSFRTVDGVTVTADAVKVRLTHRSEPQEGPAEVIGQELFVGTPR